MEIFNLQFFYGSWYSTRPDGGYTLFQSKKHQNQYYVHT